MLNKSAVDCLTLDESLLERVDLIKSVQFVVGPEAGTEFRDAFAERLSKLGRNRLAGEIERRAAAVATPRQSRLDVW